MKQRYIPDGILVEILCFLPRKSLFRLNCVSKQWYNLISHPKLIITKTTDAGLLLQRLPYYTGPSSETFLRLDNNGGACIDHSIPYNNQRYRLTKKYRICDSHDGSLLLCTRFQGNDPIYLVYNPITNFLEEVAPLTRTPHLLGIGLVSDGNHFKVIFFSSSFNVSRFALDVYSSVGKEWRRKELQFPADRDLHVFQSFSSMKPLFFKRAMHWPLPKYLLIYHLQEEFCKLIELPSADDHLIIGGQFIWEFEGCLHYCKVCGRRGNTIKIWALIMEEEKYIRGQQCVTWKHKHSAVLSPPIPITEFPSYQPFAFNEDFKILYIQCKGSVISYNPQTRKQKIAYVCQREGESDEPFQYAGFPFLFA